MDDGGIQFYQKYQQEFENLEWHVAALNSDLIEESGNGTNRIGKSEQLQASTGRVIYGNLLSSN